MPKGSKRPDTRAKVKRTAVTRLDKNSKTQSGMGAELLRAVASDIRTGKRKVFKKTQRK